MNGILQASRVCLWAETAADLMTANPVSIRDNATIKEALILFTEKGYGAAPVIDRCGRPVGVLSRYDVIVHDRETVDYVPPVPDYYSKAELVTHSGEKLKGFQVERVDRTRVRDLMTPTIFAVRPDTSAVQVIEELLKLKVHRLFVIDEDEVLVGVISALDILNHLRFELP
jgi:CBS domain-containing protein